MKTHNNVNKNVIIYVGDSTYFRAYKKTLENQTELFPWATRYESQRFKSLHAWLISTGTLSDGKTVYQVCRFQNAGLSRKNCIMQNVLSNKFWTPSKY